MEIQESNGNLVYIGWFGNNSQTSNESDVSYPGFQPLKYWWNWADLSGNVWNGSDTISIDGTPYKFTMYSNSLQTSNDPIYMNITDTNNNDAHLTIKTLLWCGTNEYDANGNDNGANGTMENAISNNYSIKLHTSSSSDILFQFNLTNLTPTNTYGDESNLKLSEKLPDIINSNVNSANINLTNSSAGNGNGEVIRYSINAGLEILPVGTTYWGNMANKATDYNSALSLNSFFNIQFTSDVAYNLQKLELWVRKGGGANPRGFFVRSSHDDYTTDLLNDTEVPSAHYHTEYSVDLTSLTNISSLTLRIYIYTPNPTSHTLAFKDIALYRKI